MQTRKWKMDCCSKCIILRNWTRSHEIPFWLCIKIYWSLVCITDSGVSRGGQPQMYIISVYLKLKCLYSLFDRTILYIYCTKPSELTRITSSTIWASCVPDIPGSSLLCRELVTLLWRQIENSPCEIVMTYTYKAIENCISFIAKE